MLERDVASFPRGHVRVMATRWRQSSTIVLLSALNSKSTNSAVLQSLNRQAFYRVVEMCSELPPLPGTDVPSLQYFEPLARTT